MKYELSAELELKPAHRQLDEPQSPQKKPHCNVVAVSQQTNKPEAYLSLQRTPLLSTIAAATPARIDRLNLQPHSLHNLDRYELYCTLH